MRSASNVRNKPHQTRSSASIEQILDAAERVFSEHGVAAATTAQIAAVAGISVGRVYYWFATKDAVAAAVADRSERSIVELFSTLLIDDGTLPTPDLVRNIVEKTVAVARQRPSVLVMLTSGPVDASAERLGAVVHAGVTHLVIERVPDIDRDEAAVVASTLVGTVVAGIHNVWHLPEDDERVDAMITEVVYIVSAYLACRFPATDNPNNVVAPARPARDDVPLPSSPLQPYLARRQR